MMYWFSAVTIEPEHLGVDQLLGVPEVGDHLPGDVGPRRPLLDRLLVTDDRQTAIGFRGCPRPPAATGPDC